MPTEVIEARAKATQMQIPPNVLTNPEAFKKFQEAQGQLAGAAAGSLREISGSQVEPEFPHTEAVTDEQCRACPNPRHGHQEG